VDKGCLAKWLTIDARFYANARCQGQEVAAFDAAARFDVITACDTIHDQAQPRQVLAAIARALRPGGVFVLVAIPASSPGEEHSAHPLGSFRSTVACRHCRTVSLAQGGEGLGTAWGEQRATELLRDAGFSQVEIKHQPADVFNSYYVCTTG